jgi:hypothetical protein
VGSAAVPGGRAPTAQGPRARGSPRRRWACARAQSSPARATRAGGSGARRCCRVVRCPYDLEKRTTPLETAAKVREAAFKSTQQVVILNLLLVCQSKAGRAAGRQHGRVPPSGAGRGGLVWQGVQRAPALHVADCRDQAHAEARQV